MSQFNDRVRDSVALSNLRETEELLNELVERDWQHQTTKDLINRLVVVVKHVMGRMTIVDRNLVTESGLGQLDQPSYYLLDYVNNLSGYADDQEPDIHNGSSLADQVLDAAYNLPVFPIRTTPEVIQRVSDQFDSEMQSKAALLEEQFEETRTRTSTVLESVNQQENRQEELAAQFEDSVTAKTNEVQSSVGGLLEHAQTSSDELLSRTREATERLEGEVRDVQTNFLNSQQQREVTFRVSEQQREDEFRAYFDARYSEIINLREQAREMLEEVAGAKTAQNYADLRDEQNRAANRWRWIGVSALVILVIASSWVFYETRLVTEDVSILSIFGRSGLLISLSVLATYALRQSGHHRQREEDNARVSNELTTLWPFINRLPEEDRQAILKELTPRYFKGGLSAHDPGDQVGWMGRVMSPRRGEARRKQDE